MGSCLLTFIFHGVSREADRMMDSSRSRIHEGFKGLEMAMTPEPRDFRLRVMQCSCQDQVALGKFPVPNITRITLGDFLDWAGSL